MAERDYGFGEHRLRCWRRLRLRASHCGTRRIREKLKYSDVPAGLQGLGITFKMGAHVAARPSLAYHQELTC